MHVVWLSIKDLRVKSCRIQGDPWIKCHAILRERREKDTHRRSQREKCEEGAKNGKLLQVKKYQRLPGARREVKYRFFLRVSRRNQPFPKRHAGPKVSRSVTEWMLSQATETVGLCCGSPGTLTQDTMKTLVCVFSFLLNI